MIGSTNTNRTVGGVVLDDGTYWVIYSQEGNSNVIAGALQGRFSTNGNTVSSSNGRDFNFEGLGVNDFTASGSVAERQSLDATVTYDGGTQVTVSAEYSSDYELTPSLSTIAGSYSGNSVASGGVEFTTVPSRRTVTFPAAWPAVAPFRVQLLQKAGVTCTTFR